MGACGPCQYGYLKGITGSGSFWRPMALYLLTSPLLTAFVVAAFFGETHARTLILPTIRGLVAGIVLLPVTLLVSAAIPLVYVPSVLWLRISVLEFLLPALLGTIAFVLWDLQKGGDGDRATVVSATGFIAGVFFVDILARVIGGRGLFDGYELFLLPMARSLLVAYIPILVSAWAREARPTRYGYLLLLVALPWVLSVAGTLHELKFLPVAYLVGLTLFASGVAGYWLLRMVYLPGQGL